MEIQCECGTFRAELTHYPRATPGRLKCYCDDCQAYLQFLNRRDLADEHGGTEIIPAYPAHVKILEGAEALECVRLYPKGLYRFYAKCCRTPIANTDPKRPWCGFNQRVYTVKDPERLQKDLGPVKASIMGKFAIGGAPAGVPATFDFKGMLLVMPYLLKGLVTGQAKPNPFFKDGKALGAPKVLSANEIAELKKP